MLLKSVREKERIKDSVPSSLRPLWFQLPIRKSRKELRKKLQYGEHSASSTTTTHCFSCAEQKTDWGSPLFPKPCSITALLFLLRHILLLFISLLHLITNADSAGTVLDVAVLHTGYILKKSFLALMALEQRLRKRAFMEPNPWDSLLFLLPSKYSFIILHF